MAPYVYCSTHDRSTQTIPVTVVSFFILCLPLNSAVALTNSTTAALHELLSTVYHLEFNERITQSSLQALLDRLKNTLRFIPWKSSVCVDETWKRGVADKQVENLSSSRLAKSICAQFRSNLVRAHDRFTLALRELEVLHSARLQETDEARCEVSLPVGSIALFLSWHDCFFSAEKYCKGSVVHQLCLSSL